MQIDASARVVERCQLGQILVTTNEHLQRSARYRGLRHRRCKGPCRLERDHIVASARQRKCLATTASRSHQNPAWRSWKVTIDDGLFPRKEVRAERVRVSPVALLRAVRDVVVDVVESIGNG